MNPNISRTIKNNCYAAINQAGTEVVWINCDDVVLAAESGIDCT